MSIALYEQPKIVQKPVSWETFFENLTNNIHLPSLHLPSWVVDLTHVIGDVNGFFEHGIHFIKSSKHLVNLVKAASVVHNFFLDTVLHGVGGVFDVWEIGGYLVHGDYTLKGTVTEIVLPAIHLGAIGTLCVANAPLVLIIASTVGLGVTFTKILINQFAPEPAHSIALLHNSPEDNSKKNV